jgi:hypothetical protein
MQGIARGRESNHLFVAMPNRLTPGTTLGQDDYCAGTAEVQSDWGLANPSEYWTHGHQGPQTQIEPGQERQRGYRLSGGMSRLSSHAVTTSSALGDWPPLDSTRHVLMPSVTESEAAAATAPRRTRTANGSAMARVFCMLGPLKTGSMVCLPSEILSYMETLSPCCHNCDSINTGGFTNSSQNPPVTDAKRFGTDAT